MSEPSYGAEPGPAQDDPEGVFWKIVAADGFEVNAKITTDRSFEEIAQDEHIADQFGASQARSIERRKRQNMISALLGRALHIR